MACRNKWETYSLSVKVIHVRQLNYLLTTKFCILSPHSFSLYSRNRFYIVLPWSKVFINILNLHMILIDLYLALYLR